MTQFKNVKVLIASGALIDLEDWQKQYGLPVGSDFIGKYFSLTESRFQKDINLFGVLIVNAPLMVVMDKVRELYGKPIIISSYNRSEEKQQSLIKEEEEEKQRMAPRKIELESLIETENDQRLLSAYKEELAVINSRLRAETSPHVAKMAADLDVKTRQDVLNLVPVVRRAIVETGIPVRIGHKLYLAKSIEVEKTQGKKDTWTFVHIDVCPLFYAKGMPFHEQPHPAPWEYQIEW